MKKMFMPLFASISLHKSLCGKALLILVTVLSGILLSPSLLAQTGGVQGFENNSVNGWTGGTAAENASVNSTLANVRTGSYSIGLNFTTTNSNRYCYSYTPYGSTASGTYVHLIYWAKASVASTSVDASMRYASSAPPSGTGSTSNGTAVALSTSAWTRVAFTSGNSNGRHYFSAPRRTTGNITTVFMDDLVMYMGSNSTADILSPNVPASTSGTYSAGDALLTWSSGGDNVATGTTGVQATLVLKYTGSGTPVAPALNNQAAYLVNDIPATDWVVVKIDGTASGSNVNVGAISANTTYALYHRDLAYNWSAASALITVPFTACATPTLSGASQLATVCAGSGAVINLSGMVPGVNSNTINYTINGVAQTPVTGVNADGSGNASFTSAVLTAGNNGQTLQITQITKDACNSSFAQDVTLSVAATSVGGTVTYNGSDICAGSQPSGNFTLAGNTGAVTKWQKSTSSDFTSGVTDIANTTTTLTEAEVGAVAVVTYVRAVVANAPCVAANAAAATINTNALPAITVQPTTTPANYPEGFGSPSAISVTATGAGVAYQWYSSTDAVTNTAGDDIALGTSSSETPSTAVQGTLYYYCVVSGTCTPSVTSDVSGAVNILPSCTNPSFSVDPTDGQSECVGGTLTLGTVVADQSPTYQWYSNATLSNSGGSSVGAGNGGSTDTYTPPSTIPGIYFYYVVATSGACSTASIPVQITVNATAIASQSTPAASYSLNASASALTVTAENYSAGLSYQWYSSTDAATNTPGDDITVGTNSNSYTPLTTSVGTLYYYVVVSGNCTPSSATSAVSGAISVVQYVTGDYVSRATGSWEAAGTWYTWNGTSLVNAASFPNSSSVNVYIDGGFTVTYNPASQGTLRSCNNLYVLNGTLKTGTTITGGNRRYLSVFGTTIEVGPNGTLGSALTGDNADAFCLDLQNNSSAVTFSGSGGLANFGLIRYNNTPEVIIDRDITINYHGSGFLGNAMAYHANGTITNDHTLTINAGKTLTFAPWSCFSATGSSGVLAAVNLYIIVNGTLTMQAYPTYYAGARGYLSTGVSAGKIFYLYIESTGTVNLREFLPNGTGGNGDPGFVEIMAGGVLNVANVTDLRNTGNAIYGDGTFNVNNGATLRLRDPLGITAAPAAAGAIQTGIRNYSTGASYTYEAVLGSQVTGDGLPASVRYLTINNTNGVSLTNSVSVDSALVLTNGKLTTGSNTVSVAATGNSITGASAANYVNGNLERAVAAGISSVAFPVGDATNYTPVSLAFGAGNTAGNVTASATAAGGPAAAGANPTGSGLSQSSYINRKWTLTSDISNPDYAATFTYINPGDVVGGANTNDLLVAKNSGGVWSQPGVATSTAPSVTTVSGLTSFSDFYLGETGSCTNNTFSGTGNWSDGTKWTCGAPPNSTDNVTIAASANATLDVDFTVAGSLVMNATSTLTVNPTRTLTVSGT
ncbi:MAG TPA: hypothetical protein PLY34_17180, partial [Ferruginibacter sp.]|nr:hypothetical protein [Ferruginibacter sp.]